MSQTVKTTRTPRSASVSAEGMGGERPPYGAAALAALAVFALYALTLAPTTQFWDTSEYITAAHIMGIPHPPGNPLFVVLARAWELLLAPTGLSVAVRINLFSAAMSAAAHGFWFLVAHRTLGAFGMGPRVRTLGAATAVLLSATAFTVWNQSNVNEKVYTVSLFTIALLSWLAFRWRDTGNARLVVLGAYLLGLTATNHLMGVLAAPALLVMVLAVRPRQLARPVLLAAVAAAAAVGWSANAVLPIRAELRPIIAEGDPRCDSLADAAVSLYTYGRSGCEALSAELQREQYHERSIWKDPTVYPQIDRPRSPRQIAAQVANFLQYFDWQWARSVAGNVSLFGGARPVFTLLFTFLGLFGAWTHYRSDRASWAYVAVLFATLSIGLVFYLNFKYGYTWSGDYPMEWREVRERDYFFIVGFSVWGLWAGIGLTALWRRLAEALAEARTRLADRSRLLTSPVLVLALLPLILNWSWASRANDYAARDWSYNLLQSVEPYGVLFTNGDNDTFPLWYLQEVEGVRRDVTVIVTSYLNTPWYVRQLRDLTAPCADGVHPDDDPTRIICQRPFLPNRAPEFYSAGIAPTDMPGQPVEALGPMMRPPTRSIIRMSDEEIGRITADFAANPAAFVIDEPLEVEAGQLEFTVPGQQLLTPADIFMLHIVQNGLGDRPIYFASTTRAYETVGLGGNLLRQGVALKLVNGLIEPDPERGIYALPPELAPALGPFLDLPRTNALLWDVFMHRGGIPDEWNHWVDRATQGIPYYYAYTHLGAAQVHAMRGDSAQAARHTERVDAWVELARK